LKQKYSIIIIPPEHNKAPRQIQISFKAKKMIYAGAAFLGILISGLLIHDVYQAKYIRDYNQKIAYMDQLEMELQLKDLEIARLNGKVAEINDNLAAIASFEKKISNILKPEVSTAISRGGFSLQSTYQAQSLDQAGLLLDNHKEIIENYYNAMVEYNNRMQCTPDFLPVSGEITSSFGYRKNPFGRYTSEFHSGIDIACSYGTPVKATADGTVTFAGWDGYWGRRVEIDHGYGVITFYAHNSQIKVKAGDSVKKGQVIAYSGNSGRSTGTHVHYTVYVNGQLVDPLNFTYYGKEQ